MPSFLYLGQNPQKKVVGAQVGEFDITEALSTRRPLRKTSTALVMQSKDAWWEGLDGDGWGWMGVDDNGG